MKHLQGGSLRFQIEYAKHGGQPKAAYQGYLLAYLDRDAGKVPAMITGESTDEGDMLGEEYVVILKTALIQRSEEDQRYDFEFEIDCDELAKKMIAHGELTEKDRTVGGGWGQYNDKIRIAFFVPFLQNERYSNLDGLPEEKHECGYHPKRPLIFQELPYELSIQFGIVQAIRMEEGQHHIQINFLRPNRAQ